MKKETKVTPQLLELTMSKLRSSHNLILFVGFSFIILAILSFKNIIILDLSTIVFISLSGILFILADFFDYYAVTISEKVNPQKKNIFYDIQILLFCKTVLIFFAILFLILSPYIKLNSSETFLNNLSTALALIAIGLTIIKISLDNAQSNSDFGKSLLIEVTNIIEAADEREKNMESEEEKIISKIVNKIVNDFTEEALSNASPELIKKIINFEIKTMFLTLFRWFIGLLSALSILNILYFSHTNNSVKDASLRIVETLDEFVIIKNYIFSGVVCVLAFAFISYIAGKFESRYYEKNRKKIIELRNIIYIIFIVSFCLQSFTVNQLDLVSLIISLVLLFKVVFKKDHTLSEKELKNIIKGKTIGNFSKEFNKEIEEKFESKNIVKKDNISNSDNKHDTLGTKIIMIIYFFYGFILLFWGNKIELFYDNITSLQKFGLFFILVGLFSYSFSLTILVKKVSLFTRLTNFIMSVTLIIGAFSIFNQEFKIPFNLEKYYIQFVFFTIFTISVRVTFSLVIIIKKINKAITDPTQKLTILIGFFGIIISLLNIF